jgi:hypothetical protein
MVFGNVEPAQDVANWSAQSQKFVVECPGDPLRAPATGVLETVRFTLFRGTHTGGGAGDLAARDDITATFDGSVHWSPTDNADLLVEFVSNSPTLT